MTTIERVQSAIDRAERGESILPPEVLDLHGMSSQKVRHFLSNLDAKRYLEVGVWTGSTFISACWGHQIDATAVDDFSQFNETGNAEQCFLANCRALMHNKIKLLNRPFVEYDHWELPGHVDTFFYDGGHEWRDHYDAIRHAAPHLAEEAVIVVDDSNIPGVIEATRQGIYSAGLETLREWELPAAHNGDTEQWWNGLYVAVVGK